MSRFWKDPQNIIALGVTLISVCALIVSITQTRVMVQQSELMDVQARASVRPILRYSSDRSFDPDSRALTGYRLVVTNSGVGPAIIDDVRVSYAGEAATGWGPLFLRFDLPDTLPTYVDNAQLNHSVLQAGQSVVILDLTDNIDLARAIYERMDALNVEILYSSIYADRFVGLVGTDGWKTVEDEGQVTSFGDESFYD